MAPGKRKSPFIGVLDTSEEPVLYQRYNNTADVLLVPKKKQKRDEDPESQSKGIDHIADLSASSRVKVKPVEDMTREELLSLIKAQREAESPALLQPSSKKSRKQSGASSAAEEQLDSSLPFDSKQEIRVKETKDTSASNLAGKDKKSKKKKKGMDEEKGTAKAASGPSNADEADRIRSIMGIRKEKAETAGPSKSFSFGFQADGPQGSQPDAEPHNGEELVEDSEPLPRTAGQSAQPRQQDGDSKQSGNSEANQIPLENGNPHLDAKLKRVMGQKDDLVARRVFVGGMPFTYDEEEVREYWSYCGEIEAVDLMRFPDTGRFKGIAFITFADEAGYREALKCNEEYIDEHKLKVEPCISAGPKTNGRIRKEETGRRSNFTAPAPKTPGYHVAYVGNLAFDANQKQIKEVLEGCNVTIIRLHTDKNTGKSMGYAHVHFADEESLDRAVQLSGQKLLGRAIKIGYAQPKKGQ